MRDYCPLTLKLCHPSREAALEAVRGDLPKPGMGKAVARICVACSAWHISHPMTKRTTGRKFFPARTRPDRQSKGVA